ncbi:MAG: hypothetical protein JWQ04_1931 [Pedosphaera sp.]|nr:hypothetical protein [Pedosphaera sp.]
MKNFSLASVRMHRALICLAVMLCASAALAEEPIHGEALLVWGTNDPHSPDPTHIPVDAELARRLGSSPYRWKYYFEVPPRQPLEIPIGETKKGIRMSKRCTLDIKNLGKSRVEVRLYGEGKPVLINTEPLTDDHLLIYAGPAGNETAWLVVVRKVKAHGPKLERAVDKSDK